MARGRPRKAGARRRDGRLVAGAAAVADRGNHKVQARAAAFAMFHDGKAGEQLADAIGRAWLCGLLDGKRIDAAVLRDVGRRYAMLHARVYAANGVRTAILEPRGGGRPQRHAAIAADTSADPAGRDPVGEAYARLDGLAQDAGAKPRLALRKLCMTASPDVDPEWLGRLIAARRAGALPAPRDRWMLDQAIAALLAMAEGRAGRSRHHDGAAKNMLTDKNI